MGQIESWQFYVMFCFYWFLCFTCFCIPRWLLVERRQRWWKWWNWVNWILATLWSNYWVIRVPWLAAALFCFFCLSRSPTLAPEIGAIVIHSTQNWRRFSYLYALGQKTAQGPGAIALSPLYIVFVVTMPGNGGIQLTFAAQEERGTVLRFLSVQN